jgi:hypothetical protein
LLLRFENIQPKGCRTFWLYVEETGELVKAVGGRRCAPAAVFVSNSYPWLQQRGHGFEVVLRFGFLGCGPARGGLRRRAVQQRKRGRVRRGWRPAGGRDGQRRGDWRQRERGGFREQLDGRHADGGVGGLRGKRSEPGLSVRQRVSRAGRVPELRGRERSLRARALREPYLRRRVPRLPGGLRERRRLRTWVLPAMRERHRLLDAEVRERALRHCPRGLYPGPLRKPRVR